MSFVKWGPDLELGYAVIDDQHKILVEMIVELEDALAAGRGRQVQNDILGRITNYTVYHFTEEEKHFISEGYLNSVKHLREHQAFIEKIKTLNKGAQAGNLGIALDLVEFLANWLRTHILERDRELVEILQKNHP